MTRPQKNILCAGPSPLFAHQTTSPCRFLSEYGIVILMDGISSRTRCCTCCLCHGGGGLVILWNTHHYFRRSVRMIVRFERPAFLEFCAADTVASQNYNPVTLGRVFVTTHPDQINHRSRQQTSNNARSIVKSHQVCPTFMSRIKRLHKARHPAECRDIRWHQGAWVRESRCVILGCQCKQMSGMPEISIKCSPIK